METTTAAAMVAAAKQRITNLTVEQVAIEVDNGEVLLVDVREPEEQGRDGIIPGAIHSPRGMLEFYADPTNPYHRPEFDPRRRVILYCKSGGRSALAADMLRQLGYTRVGHLDGGLNAWKEAGQPLTQCVEGTPTP